MDLRHGEDLSQNSLTSNALSWEPGTSDFSGVFFLVTTQCKTNKTWCDCRQGADLWGSISKGNNSRDLKCHL